MWSQLKKMNKQVAAWKKKSACLWLTLMHLTLHNKKTTNDKMQQRQCWHQPMTWNDNCCRPVCIRPLWTGRRRHHLYWYEQKRGPKIVDRTHGQWTKSTKTYFWHKWNPIMFFLSGAQGGGLTQSSSMQSLFAFSF